MTKRRKLRHRPRKFGWEFWPPDDHPELAIGFVDLPGGDVVLNGCVELSVGYWDDGSWRSKSNGRPTGIEFDFLANDPDVTHTFTVDYGNSPADAQAAIEMAESGADVFDYYFEAVREGFTDKEYLHNLEEQGLPASKGRFVLRWKKAIIPPIVRAMAKGRVELNVYLESERFKVTHKTTVDSRGGSWIGPRVTKSTPTH